MSVSPSACPFMGMRDGKTHLSHIWQEKTKARYLSGNDFNQVQLETLFDGGNLSFDDAENIDREESFFISIIIFSIKRRRAFAAPPLPVESQPS